MAEFTMLYSGSSGNSALLKEDDKCLLIDMGKSATLTNKKLLELNVNINMLEGILITHEHIDHVAGLNVFLKKHNIPVYSKSKTLDYLYKNRLVPHDAKLIDLNEREVEIGSFKVKAFQVPHDAQDCTGFRISTKSGKTLAYASDLGNVSEEVYGNLQNAHLVALEANYDYNMLIAGFYPDYLKRRIHSDNGHLRNEDCAKTLLNLHKSGCDKFVLCHISDKNNTAALALESIRAHFIENGVIPNENFSVLAASRHEITPITKL